MKRLLILLIGLVMVAKAMAQVEYVYDFNGLTEGTQNLNGQDGWMTHYQTASSSQDFDVSYVCGSDIAPDESKAIWYPYGGAGVGRTATRKASANFNFSFQEGGIMDLEMDMNRTWWGNFFGVGFDGNGDGHVLPGMTDEDGGIYVFAKGQGESGHAQVFLPNGNSVEFAYDQGGWNRYKMSFDFDAFNGEGSVTVFVQPGCQGEWIQQAAATNVNMHLTPGSGDKNDYHVWDAVFFHSQGGTGGFDNLLVRQQPPGSAQLIEMEDIPNQLVFNEPITLVAEASSGLPVSFVMMEGPATINGNVLTLTGAPGTVKFKAVQAGNDTWLPAPDVVKSFEVVDPEAYDPEVTLRRPYTGQKVYLKESHPVMIVVSAYIEHAEVIKFEEIRAKINGGEDILLRTDYPDNPENGYYYGFWTPEGQDLNGENEMVVRVRQSGGKTTSYNSSFTVTEQVDNQLDVVTMHGDLVCDPSHHSAQGNYTFPSHVGVFNAISAHYDHTCMNHNCDGYDRVGGVKIRNYRGEWIELFRYITPFGVECNDDIDVTDYTSMLQGLVEIEFYMESWGGNGYNPTLIFTFTKGTPEHLYIDVDEIWFGSYGFGDYANQQPVPRVNYTFSDAAVGAHLRIMTSGHNWSSGNNNTNNTGNAAEFYEATHHLFVNGVNRMDQHLWRTCNPNPTGCQPQNGTWTYPRSGWCPGSIPMVWNMDLSDQIHASAPTELFYQFDPTYLDFCHPNHPDCVDGVTCTECAAPDNPILKVSGQVVTYSDDANLFVSVHEDTPAPAFDVQLYPNPASHQLRLVTDYDQGAVSVLMLNMQGQEVMYFTFEGERTLDVSQLPVGVYLVKMLAGQVITKKVVINR